MMQPLCFRKNPVPFRLGHHAHEPGVADAGVADQNIHLAALLKGLAHRSAIGYVTADGRGTGFFRHGLSGLVVLFVQEINPVTQLAKQLHSRGANAPGAAGDKYSSHFYSQI